VRLGDTFCGDGLYTGDGGSRLERLWRLDDPALEFLRGRCCGDDHGASLRPPVLPWIPLRRCDGRYSLGRQWADRLGRVPPEVIATAVVASSRGCIEGAASGETDDATWDTADGGAAAAVDRGRNCCRRGGTPLADDFVALRTHNAAREKGDPIAVIRFRGGGGLLSYCKLDGRYVHTFNTESGLCRKVMAVCDAATTAQLVARVGGVGGVLVSVCCRVLGHIDDAHGERTRLAPTIVVTVRRCLARQIIAKATQG